eukprot:m.22935 g.22935  ORF g.22935 m.22935 type:complete len:1333 (+) comp28426_c0_seq2:147-4145(+)
MLKKILKRKDDNPTSPLNPSGSRRQPSLIRSPSRDASADLAIAKLLELNVEKEQDIDHLRGNARKLMKALKDERDYTKSLKSQVDRLHLVQMQPSNQVQEELMVVKKMFEETDQARFEATSELEQVKQTLANLEAEHEKTKAVGQRAAQTAAEMAALKSECDEYKSKNVAMEAQIGVLSDELIRRNQDFVDLKHELESRPTVDDVLLLKREMQALQENFLKAALEKEAEMKEIHKKRNDLSEEWAKSQARIKALEAELGAKSMTSSEHVQRLEFQVQELRDKLAEAPKQTEFDRQSEKIRELEKKIAESEKPEEVARLQERVKFLDVQLSQAPKQRELDEKLTLITELQTVERNRKEGVQHLESKVKELEQEVREAPKKDHVNGLEQRLQETADALKVSRSEVSEKEKQHVECQKELKQTAGVLAEKESTVVRLVADLEKANTLAREEATVKGASQEEAKQKQKLLDEELRRVASKERRIEELEGDLCQVQESVSRLESERADLIEKIEAGEGVATAIDQLSREKEILQQRLTQTEEAARAEVNALQTTAEEKERHIGNLSDEVQTWKEKFRQQGVELSELQQQRDRLAEDFDAKASALADVERESQKRQSDLEEKVASGKEALQSLEDLLKKTELEYGQVKRDLTRELEDTRAERNQIVSDLEEKSKEKDIKIEALESSLSVSVNEGKALLERANKADNLLSALRADYEALDSAHASTKNELEEKVQKLDSSHKEVCQKSEELMQRSAALQDSFSASSKESDLLKSQLSESEVRASKLNTKIEELEKQLKKVSTSGAAERDSYEAKLAGMGVKVSDVEREAKALEAALDVAKGSSAELKTRIDEKTYQMQGIQDELTAVKLQNEELEQQIKSEKEKASAFQGQLTELDSQLVQKIADGDSHTKQLSNQLSQKEDQIKAMQSDLEMIHHEVERKGSVCSNYELQLVRSQSELKEERARVVSLEKELDGVKRDLLEMNTQSDVRGVELANLKKSAEETDSLMNSTVKQLTEVKSALSDRVLEQDGQLKELRADVKELTQEKDDLNALLKAKETAIMNATQRRSDVEREREELSANLTTEKEERSKEQKIFEDVKTKLTAQIQVLESSLQNLKKEKNRMESEIETTEAKLRVRIASMTSELEETKKSHISFKDSYEDMKVQHEVEMSALSRNLATLRTDLEASKQNVSAEQGVSNKLRGDIAVLQASVQNFQDERRKLLERCVSNDEEMQKLRSHAAGVKQRLDEARAALQDLGRENASLQVNQTRQRGRRWMDDKDVLECTSCKKAFSFAVRRHHCRSCGLIFCYECSAKAVQLPAYKDPVRVCDGCFKEKTT